MPNGKNPILTRFELSKTEYFTERRMEDKKPYAFFCLSKFTIAMQEVNQ